MKANIETKMQRWRH